MNDLTCKLLLSALPLRALRTLRLAVVSLLLGPALAAAADSSCGLWVGEIVLTKVNETVVGINAANQVAAPDPSVTTPTADKASLRLILHVDGGGQVRLLKSVAVFNRDTNSESAGVALVTDEALYPAFASRGKRISAAAFDFGEGKAAALLNLLAEAVANAAGTNATGSGAAATNAARQLQASADLDAAYRGFATGGTLRNASFSAAASAAAGATTAKSTNGNIQQLLEAALAAATNDYNLAAARVTAAGLQAAALFEDTRYVAAVDSVARAAAIGAASAADANAALAAAAAAERARDGSETDIVNRAKAAALTQLYQAKAFAAADAVPLLEAKLSGNLAAGGVVAGELFLGANHPTNPFRHRRHSDHTQGFSLTRRLTLEVSTNGLEQVGFGVDRLSGIYKEEIFGLHKPLGPMQDIGLKTEGIFNLNRLSLVDTLNQ